MKSSVFKFTFGCSDNFGLDCMTSKTRKGQMFVKTWLSAALNFPRLIRALSLTLKELMQILYLMPQGTEQLMLMHDQNTVLCHGFLIHALWSYSHKAQYIVLND